MVVKVLIHTGVHVKALTMIYNLVVQTVLPYGYQSWVVTDAMITVLDGFYHRVDWILAGLTERQGNAGKWEWPPVAMALEATGLW